jgi:hypothetical protein
MLVAITDSYPNQPFCAETEFTRRFKNAAEAAGHTVIQVITSDDIHACKPDFVLCLSEDTPKLTHYPTLGAMWSPPEIYKDNPYKVRSIRSHDAYLVGSEQVRLYLEDLECSSGVAKPKSDFHFLPVAQERPFVDRKRRSLTYVGVHWDGSRHGEIINKLIKRNIITIYGPQPSWSHLKSGYGGEIPFDGTAVYETLGAHGVALCFHKDTHRAADTPSARLFEAAAAGCVIIADEMPFAKRVLGDAALYVDLRKPPLVVAEAIANHLNELTANPEKASALARRAHELLNQQYGMESLVRKTCDFAGMVAQTTREKRALVRRHYVKRDHEPQPANTGSVDRTIGAAAHGASPVIDVIVRCGGRTIDYVQRAVDALEKQTAGPLRALLVDYKERADIEAFATNGRYENVRLTYLRSPNNGFRSSTLWTGLANVTAPFFAVLDDDDEIMPDHFCGLLYSAIKNPDASFIYCGAIKVQEEKGHYHRARNFQAKPGGRERIIPETRELKFLDEFNLARFVMFDNYILSNAWIARSGLLDHRLLVDPKMEYAEDLYLSLILAARTKFVCSHQATAYWNWRSETRDNSTFDLESPAWRRCAERILLRLRDVTFEHSVTLQELRALAAGPMNFSSSKKKPVGPLRKLLHSIPAYKAYRDRRSYRRRAKALANGHAAS